MREATTFCHCEAGVLRYTENQHFSKPAVAICSFYNIYNDYFLVQAENFHQCISVPIGLDRIECLQLNNNLKGFPPPNYSMLLSVSLLLNSLELNAFELSRFKYSAGLAFVSFRFQSDLYSQYRDGFLERYLERSLLVYRACKPVRRTMLDVFMISLTCFWERYRCMNHHIDIKKNRLSMRTAWYIE